MKSKAAFDPSKPFVFPPVRRSAPSGCANILAIAFIIIVVMSVYTALTQSKNLASAAPATTNDSHAVALPSVPPISLSPQSAANPENARNQTMPSEGAGALLRDITTFPVTIIVTRQINVLNENGGFGLNPGDELIVTRKQGANYVIASQGKEYTLDAKLVDDMRAK